MENMRLEGKAMNNNGAFCSVFLHFGKASPGKETTWSFNLKLRLKS